MTDTSEIDVILEAVRETHPTTEPITHGSDTLVKKVQYLRKTHGLDATAPNTAPSKPNYLKRRVVATLGVTAAAAGLVYGGYKVAEDLFNNEYYLGAEANFSPESNSWVAGQGEGLQDAAKTVEGSDSVDLRIIQEEIEARNPEALADGLQAGEQLMVPVSVEPKS